MFSYGINLFSSLVSDDLNGNFSAYLSGKSTDLGINFNIYVLQAGAWPLGQTAVSSFAIPQILERSVSSFEGFYASKFNGRKLTWLHHLCNAEVKFTYTKKSYLVTMGTYHMAVLLLFESSDTCTYQELQENTQLTEEQLQKHLQSLTDAKILLVSSDGENSTIEKDTIYTLNKSYANKRLKFKITAVQQKEIQQVDIEIFFQLSLLLNPVSVFIF